MKNKILFSLLIFGCYLPLTFAQCLIKINSGDNFNYGIKSDGTLWNWGNGSFYGQLGTGTLTDRLNPTQLGTASSWQKIVCGDANFLGIKADGTLWVTGNNNDGQLGLGAFITYTNTLTQMGTATDWKQVDCASEFTYAIKTNGTLWAWGRNDSYQMGNTTCCDNQYTPVQIGTDTNWKKAEGNITGGGVALKTNGTLWGWGQNFGILGTQSVSTRSTPYQVSSATDWADFELGNSNILALKTNGTLWAWGGGDFGENGDGLSLSLFRSTPVQIGTSTWKYITCGFGFSLGIKSDGTLWATGYNDHGQLGDGTTINRTLFTQIGTDNDWAAVAGGFQHAVGIKTNGALWVWGDNTYGQLGNGTTSTTLTTSPSAVAVLNCTLATDTFDSDTFVLSPNPAKQDISFSYRGTTVVNRLVIYDLTGREVYASGAVASATLQATIPIQELQSGIYLFTLQANNKTIVAKKFVKE